MVVFLYNYNYIEPALQQVSDDVKTLEKSAINLSKDILEKIQDILDN